MLRFVATIHKELLLLKRDWVGLLVLFVMPAVLVVVITLVQDNAMKVMGRSTTEILFVNHDDSPVGNRIESALKSVEGVKLVETIDQQAMDNAAVFSAVARGDYQVGLIVPARLTAAVKTAARRAMRAALAMENGASEAADPSIDLQLLFDPTVPGTFRSAIRSQLQLLMLKIEMEEKTAALAQLLPVKMRANLEKALGPLAANLPAEVLAQPDLNLDGRPLVAISEQRDPSRQDAPMPDAVQQNVPAWSLFGIFFIVLPMAGSFIKERQCGAQHRMLSMPVSYLTIATAKVCAYMLVCLVQLVVILCIGRWLLPLLGASPFHIGAAAAETAAVALSAIAAATAYGLLLGTVVNSYEQASMFGPISVVIAAAIGGIMVPVYAMPPLMQKLSTVSPLGWAQDAFLNLLVRDAGLSAVKADIFALLGFALACIGTACGLFVHRYRRGRL